MTNAKRSFFYTIVLLMVLLAFYGWLCLLWTLGDRHLYFQIVRAYGFGAFDRPFLDLSNIPEAMRCKSLGFDVLEVNPCDVLGRTMSYSPLWLDVTPGCFIPEYVGMAGVMLDFAVIAIIPLVARPFDFGSLLVLAAAGLSTDVIFALERGNVDLIIFILVILSAVAWGGNAMLRSCAYVLCLAAGLLKFYPLSLIVIVLRERISGMLLACIVFAAVVGVFVLHYGSAILTTLRHVARPSYFGDAFGAKNLPWGIVALVSDSISGQMFIGAVAFVLIILVTTSSVMLRQLRDAGIVLDCARFDIRMLMIGSVLLESCFVAGQSIGYRGIFLILLLPGLLTIHSSAPTLSLRRILTLTIGIILFAMWIETFRFWISQELVTLGRYSDATVGWAMMLAWLAREALWWWIVGVLAALTVLFMLQSPLVRWLLTGRSLRTRRDG